MYETMTLNGEIITFLKAHRIGAHFYKYVAIASDVLVVAVINEDVGDWTAYVKAVPGQNHDEEYIQVADRGAKLMASVAALYFPAFAAQFRWRT